jgi:phospholipid/cholesterol/gamma-HCH transport system substrate-binding protein
MSDEEYRVTHPAVIRHLGLKVGFLAVLTAALLAGFVAYILYARGAFETTQQLTLVTDSAEGVSVGMDLTFRGFPVGRVRRITLGPDARARVEITIARDDARWLRANSVFTLERSVVGGAKLRAFTSDLGAAPLADGALREVIRGDATEEIPQILANAKKIIENIERMTGEASAINASLANVQTVTQRMAGKGGALEAALGSAENAQKVLSALDRTNQLLASLQGVSAKVDSAVGRADQRVLGAGGVLDEAQKAAAQLNALLAGARESLKKADAVLANAQAVSAEAKAATGDLGALRAEVDASVRKIGALIDEVNRKWPFARDTELRLP